MQKRTADYKARRDYGESEADLGKIRDYDEFLFSLRKIFEQVYVAMKPKSYCCVVVMDLRKKSQFYAYHRDVSLFMEDIGFIFDDLIIWDRGHEYNNLRPLGYPNGISHQQNSRVSLNFSETTQRPAQHAKF